MTVTIIEKTIETGEYQVTRKVVDYIKEEAHKRGGISISDEQVVLMLEAVISYTFIHPVEPLDQVYSNIVNATLDAFWGIYTGGDWRP